MTVNYARPNGEGGRWSIMFEVLPDGKNIRLMRTSGWIHDIYTTEPYMNLADSIAIHDELRLLARDQRGIFRLIASQLKTESSIYRWIEELASKHQIAF
jgi:hypothetical protein